MAHEFLINLSILRNARANGNAISLHPFFLSIRKSQRERYAQLRANAVYARDLVRSMRHGLDRFARADDLSVTASQCVEHQDFTPAIRLWRKAASLFEQNGAASRAGAEYVKIGQAYSRLDQTEDAIEAYDHALEIAGKAEDLGGKATAALELGILYRDLNDTTNALAHFEQALDAARETGNLAIAGHACYGLGGLYLELDDREHAESYLEQFITISMVVNERDGAAIGYCETGAAYAIVEDFNTAQAWFLKAGPLLSPDADPNLVLLTYMGSGYSFLALGQRNMALEYFAHALEIALGVKAEILSANLNFCSGVALMRLNNAAVAAGYFQQAVDVYLRMGELGKAALALNNLAITLCLTKGVGWGLATFHEIFRTCSDEIPDELALRIIENVLIAAGRISDPKIKAEQSGWASRIWQQSGYTPDEVGDYLEILHMSWRMVRS